MEAPLLVEGNVDIRYGDVEAPGSVVVRGDVRSGRSVSAKGSITIHGVVEAATIVAEGDVSVQHGVAGRSKGSISAQGKITLGYVSEAKLDSKSGIVIGSSAMNSTLLTDGDVVIEGDGVLVGGVVMAAGNLTAGRVGHKGVDLWEKGVAKHIVEKTTIMLGFPPNLRKRLMESRPQLSLAEKSGRAAARNVQYLLSRGVPEVDETTSERLMFLAKAPVSVAFLLGKGAKAAAAVNEELRMMLADIAQELPLPHNVSASEHSALQDLSLHLYHLFAANDFVIDVHKDIEALLGSPKLNKNAAFYARDTVYKGVELTIGFAELAVDQLMGGTVFKLAGDEIVAEPWTEGAVAEV
ncbi:MAG TPA: FapA family protein [bacterium]|nr:FapA family protein [bacterium]